VASASLKPGAAVTVSIRPHEIALAPASSPRTPGEGVNVLRGIVQRTSYLGDAIDYQVQVDGSDVVLRVAGPPPAAVRAGQEVTLTLPAAACVPLTDTD